MNDDRAQSLQLRAYGEAELDGTHRAIIESTRAEHLRPQSQSSDEPVFISLAKDDASCGCILAEIRPSNEDVIRLDRFKQITLKSRDGDSVVVRSVAPPTARQVRLSVRPEFLQRDLSRLIGKPLTRSETTAVFALAGQPRLIQVLDVNPRGIIVVGTATEIVTSVGADVPADTPVTYADIGGLSREIKSVRELIEHPLRFPAIFDHFGILPPKGVILYGPPGTGKTLIVRALVNEVGARIFIINGPEIYSKWYGESEKRLREIFEEAAKSVPAIIVIDELDALAPKRDATPHEGMGLRIVSTLLTLMDGVTKQSGVVVVGTTNRINSIDGALRREGRFGHEIHVGVPDSQGREGILRIHTRRMPLGADVSIGALADRSAGFVGADIASLCREAAYSALRRAFVDGDLSQAEPADYGALQIEARDFDQAFVAVPPSAMKEFIVEIPNISWESIGGLEEVKQLLIENIVYPLIKREAFRKAGVTPARGILLYGPPGTGKTLLAKAVASQCAVNFISVKGPELRSKWQGESAERIRFLFQKAREAAPCLLFFDEVDAAAPARRGHEYSADSDMMVNQLLSEIDGIQSSEGIFMIGATNRRELLDAAMLRPGRFDYHIEIPLPDPKARQAIFRVHLKEKPNVLDLDLVELVTSSQGFSGADITETCRRAAMGALQDAGFEETGLALHMDHLRSAIASVRAGML